MRRPTPTRLLASSLAISATLVAASVLAQPVRAPPAGPPPAAPPAAAPPAASLPPLEAATAIGRVAEILAASLPASLPQPALVVAAPLTSEVAAPRGDDLARTLAALVAGRRRLAVAPEPLAFESARTAARSYRALVHVRPSIQGGALRATADVVLTPPNRWARLRDPTPAPVAHAFAESPLDAEVRAHLVPIPLTALAPTRGKSFESGIVALACDDLDGDGAPEIVSVSRSRVVLLRLREGKVVPIFARTWSELSPVAPAPLREPIGFAVVLPAPRAAADLAASRRDVVVSITDRAESVRLDARLEVLERHPRLAVPDGEGIACAQTMGLLLTGPLAPCTPGAGAPATPSIGGRYDAFASARLVQPDGRLLRFWAGREDGVLELRDGTGRAARVPGVGAQLALGDLDQDGAVEILTSLDVADPVADAVLVRSWPAGAPPKELFRMPAGSGVSALATCPPEGGARQAFVVATGDEIVVVR